MRKMKNTYTIPVEYSKRTGYQLGALAREIMLRRLEPTEQLGTNLRVKWWNRNLENVDLISTSIDGPYLLSMRSLGTSALNKYSFNQNNDRINVEFDAATDLTKLDLTQVPHEIERTLLDSDSVSDVMPRDSPREVDREEAEEMFAILSARHIAGSRIAYPQHSRELIYEIPTEYTPDFDETLVSDWINQAFHTPPAKISYIHDKLYELSKDTAFSTAFKEVFVWELTNILTAYRQRQIALRATDSGKPEHINPESAS